MKKVKCNIFATWKSQVINITNVKISHLNNKDALSIHTDLLVCEQINKLSNIH